VYYSCSITDLHFYSELKDDEQVQTPWDTPSSVFLYLHKQCQHKVMVFAILTGYAPVRKHLCTMGLFEGDPTCRFCRKEVETVQHIVCGCEALAHQRYNVFGCPFVEPKDISTASVRNLCLFVRGKGLLNLC
jgi:hypothetical protein